MISGHIELSKMRIAEKTVRGMSYRKPLTRHEEQTLRAVARNKTRKEIAEEMGVGETTVAEFRQRACLKIGIWGVAGITHWAIEHGVVKIGDFE